MARQPKHITPKLTDITDWRIPQTNGKYHEALSSVPRDGQWYILASGLGFTSGEQVARTMNHPAYEYEFGYRVYSVDGEFFSDLAARYIVKKNNGGTTKP